MGGNTDADSECTGAESAEEVTPEDEQRIEQARAPTETHPHSSRPALVLIAEDEGPIADAIALIVEDAGFTPLIAIHGSQALDLARQHRPALVITDLMMPHLDGAELITALRADAEQNDHSPAPVILMTAAGMKRAYEIDADAVLRKPFELDELEQLLFHFLGKPPETSA